MTEVCGCAMLELVKVADERECPASLLAIIGTVSAVYSDRHFQKAVIEMPGHSSLTFLSLKCH